MMILLCSNHCVPSHLYLYVADILSGNCTQYTGPEVNTVTALEASPKCLYLLCPYHCGALIAVLCFEFLLYRHQEFQEYQSVT